MSSPKNAKQEVFHFRMLTAATNLNSKVKSLKISTLHYGRNTANPESSKRQSPSPVVVDSHDHTVTAGKNEGSRLRK
jgi:hypothetical protein